jgi:hypothetical protein
MRQIYNDYYLYYVKNNFPLRTIINLSSILIIQSYYLLYDSNISLFKLFPFLKCYFQQESQPKILIESIEYVEGV